ncbi:MULTISPECIES: hypothetical protein [unclassified Mesorhizobium]|uniref:hypothetical protein n=1 Tax=unclassified Mesorhizobium TaxID=325217 RepID=UPI001FDF17AC|nr:MULTISPECIES: hypothetical protein [unclassified Mesorhizobium]
MSPSITDATPAIGAGFGPIKSEGWLWLCRRAVWAASAPAAATVTKISRRGTLAQRRARERRAPLRFRHWSDRLS